MENDAFGDRRPDIGGDLAEFRLESAGDMQAHFGNQRLGIATADGQVGRSRAAFAEALLAEADVLHARKRSRFPAVKLEVVPAAE